MATFHFSKMADFDRLENTEQETIAPKTNQLCPTKINVCKWQLLLLFNPLLTVKEN